MAAKDGDGWALCERGHRHWGVHGASGLLAVHYDLTGLPHVLMQKRASWSHHGGTWGLPGGALDSHEDAVTGAMREALEEAALRGDGLRVLGVYTDDHGGWSFQTVIAEAESLFPAAPANDESTDMRWLPAEVISAEKLLHPGFAETWPAILPALPPSVVVLDAANIVGARAEHGWWRDRAGAAKRLLEDVEERAVLGLTPPEGFPAPARWFPRIVLVVEGAARGVHGTGSVTVVEAPGSGDDAIVETVGDLRRARPWERVLVVTADRGLRRRVEGLGAEYTGPSWVLGQLRPRGRVYRQGGRQN
ncbi:NUDIX hydrolase [Sphaerisporangium corydalis]|uniref:NUDIX domain-containing protein n=1 Tax=Sphaerisporangium corydalis TaxID=1441875 RepID=A0ABV9EH66_9ACTN|nr:NUDIX hydrolase [Sphaerisporangium corydalis]